MFEMFVSNSSVSPEILELLLSSWYREVLKQHQGHGLDVAERSHTNEIFIRTVI